MQLFQTISSEQIALSESPALEKYGIRQRLMSATLSLAITAPASATCAMANSALPVFAPHVTNPGLSSASAVPRFSHASSAGLLQPLHTNSYKSALPQVIHTSKNLMQAVATQLTGSNDLNLGSAAPLFSPKGLAGFNTLTIDIGGKQQTVTINSKLTAAELVAAQQVASGGKQAITISSKGIATGGYFDLSSSSISSLDSDLGGSLNSLVVPHGVRAVDTLSTLALSGSLLNMGTLTLGAGAGAKGQSVETITAANIYNSPGAKITSATAGGGLTPAGITLEAGGVFYNSGTVSSSGGLNISAPVISNVSSSGAVVGVHGQPVLSAAKDLNLVTQSLTNSGLISSTGGNINISSGGANNNLTVNATGGVVQASNGNISLNQSANSGSGNLTVTGGNWLSQQLNFNAGTGTIEADLGQVSGEINGTAGCAHITAATDNLQLGNIAVSGDPTYFNQTGDITIDGKVSATSGADLALVASGNIIANGGVLDTSSGTNGGNITLVAGANITAVSGTSGTTGASATIANSSNPFQGSTSGGFIDLSGTTFTTKANAGQPIQAINSSGGTGSGGDITMVAYQGKGANSGNIAASIAPNQTTAAGNTVNAGTGNVTLMGGGGAIFVQNVSAGTITITGNAPTITGGPITFTNGTNTGPGSFAANPGKTTTAVLVDFGTIQTSAAPVLPAAAINITSFGTVEGVSLISAGAAGVSGVKGGNGADGGRIAVTAGSINIDVVDSSGGGGAGGNSPGANGGNGGKAGDISLTSTSGNIQINNGINASGGGGGGGGGSNTSAVGGLGGSGGTAGAVTILASGSLIGPAPTSNIPFPATVLAYDGGAGGQGGAGSGVSGGGGGGGGGSFGGGGGGGAGAGVGTGNAAGGGGGGGTGAGGGGGGTDGSLANPTGGGGGSSASTLLNGIGSGPTGGTGGTGSGTSTSGAFGGMGAGGNTSSGIGGSGGTPPGFATPPAGGPYGSGGDGGQSQASTGGAGVSATTVAGNGVVSISVGGKSGTSALPIEVDATSLSIAGTTKNANIFIGSADNAVNLAGASMFAGTTLSVIVPTAGIAVNGPVVGGSVVTLNAGGDISGSALISATTVNLITNSAISLAPSFNITATVAATSVSANSVGNSVNISLVGTPGKVTNILSSSVASGGLFSVSSPQEINVAGVISAVDGKVSLNESGSTSAVGINVAVPMNVGTTAGVGEVDLTTTGGGSILDSKVITAPVFLITASGAVGTSAKPLLTDTLTSMTLSGSTASPMFIKDASTASPLFVGSNTVGGSVSIVTAAQNATFGNMNFGNVTIQSSYTNTKQAGTMTLGSTATDQIGDGNGVVSITSASSAIDQGSGLGIFGSSVILKSTGSSVGGTGNLTLTTPVLTASAAKGSVNIDDKSGVTLNAGSALTNYNVTANSIVVNGAIGGGNINLIVPMIAFGAISLDASVGSTKTSQVSITASGGISQLAKAVVSGQVINFTNATFGNIGTTGVGGQPIVVNAGTSFSVSAPSSSTSSVSQIGKGALAASAGAATSVLNIVDKSALQIIGAVTFPTMAITAPSISLLTTTGKAPTTGSISASKALTLVTPIVSVAQKSSISSPLSTTITSAGALSISGAGTMNLAGTLNLGNLAGPGVKATTGITLGDAKTGQNSPMETQFAKLTDLTIQTTGNFTSVLNGSNALALNNTGAGGMMTITAGNIVDLNNTNLSPIKLSANGAAASASGSIFLTLTGKQAVTLDSKNGAAKTSAPYDLTVNAGGGQAGTIVVKAGGSLTAHTGGVNLKVGAGGGSLTLSGGKGLAVDDMLNNTFNYSNITLSSASTAAFLVAGGGVNGTAGDISAANVSINASGVITTNVAGGINATATATFSNSAGVLTMVGASGGIVTGPSLTLTAKSGIILGNAKTGANNPFANFGDASKDGLLSLTIDAGSGNFASTLSTNSISLAETGNGGTLSISAANIVNIGSTTNTPITISANALVGNNAGSVNLNLTGTEAVTLDSVQPTSTKAPAPFQVEATGNIGSGNVTVQAAGALTVNLGGVQIPVGASTLSLCGGKGLAVADPVLLTSVSDIGNLTLSSGAAAPLQIGAATVSAGANAVLGNISANNIKVVDVGGITVLAGQSVTGAVVGSAVEFDTKSFVNNGSVVGGSTSTLVFGVGASTGTNGISITTAAGGNYDTNFTTLKITANGAVSTGNLFNGTNFSKGDLASVTINTPGSVTFDPVNPTLTAASNGIVNIQASAIVSKATLPITIDAPGGSPLISITTTGNLTIGTSQGDVDITAPGASASLTLVSKSGTLSLSEANLSTGIASLSGGSVVVNNTVTGTLGLDVFSTGKAGAITTATGASLNASAGTLLIASANPKLSKAQTTVQAATVQLGFSNLNGALNLVNTSAVASDSISGSASIAALNYSSQQATTNIGNITTTAGGINITSAVGANSLQTVSGAQLSTSGGGINLVVGGSGSLTLQSNTTLGTSAGSVTLQNMGTGGSITLDSGVTIHASGTAKGVGQVNIVFGAVPKTGMIAGTTPVPNPTTLTSGGAAITFGVVSGGSSISTTGANLLNAAGRNIVFNEGNGAGPNGTISLLGGDSLIADPPVGGSSLAFAAVPLAGANTISLPLVSSSPAQFLMSANSSAPALATVSWPSASLSATQLSLQATANNAADSTSSVAFNALSQSRAGNNMDQFRSMPLQGKVSLAAEASNVFDDADRSFKYAVHAPGPASKIEKTLRQGPLLLAPQQDTTVFTGAGRVDVAADAVALIIAFDGGVAVYNLHDYKRDSVVIHNNHRKLSIAPGRNAVLTTRDVHYFEEVNPAVFVGYRRLASQTFPEGTKTFLAEFSVPSLLCGLEPLNHLLRSRDSHEQKMAKSVLKTAAILMSIRDSSPYERMAIAEVTAMASHTAAPR